MSSVHPSFIEMTTDTIIDWHNVARVHSRRLAGTCFLDNERDTQSVVLSISWWLTVKVLSLYHRPFDPRKWMYDALHGSLVRYINGAYRTRNFQSSDDTLNWAPFTQYTSLVSLVFCCYQQVYDIFNMSRGDTPGEGPWWHVYIPHFSAYVYCGQTVAHLSNCWALVNIIVNIKVHSMCLLFLEMCGACTCFCFEAFLRLVSRELILIVN